MTDKRFIKNPVEAYEKLKQECKALRDEKAYADMACGQFKKQSDRYFQILIEIKEYFIKECEICKEQYAITNENCADCQAQEFLQKIDEVLNDR